MQIRIIYSSKAKTAFTHSDLEALALKSAEENKDTLITGFLMYRNGFFFQYLEGKETAVKALLSRIHPDNRHEILEEAYLESSEKKVFPEWNMEYICNADLESHVAVDEKRFIIDCWSMLLPETLLRED